MTDTKAKNSTILVVDDDPDILETLSLTLGREYNALTADSGDAAIALLRTRSDVYCVILDIRMPGKDGLETADGIREVNKTVPIIFYTAYPGDYDQREILKKYLPYNYVTKGEDPVILRNTVRNAVNHEEQRYDPWRLAEIARREYGMVGSSSPMIELYRDIERIARVAEKVLILGERGSGKEHVAKGLHIRGPRREQRYETFNCSSVEVGFIKTAFFGIDAGAFPGAVARDGLFRIADGGDVFLDEIADLPPESQAELLRFLMTGDFKKIGSAVTEHADAHIFTATNRDLGKLISLGRFKADFYSRISAHTINVPPLAKRVKDIPLLVEHFMAGMCRKRGLAHKHIDRDAMDLLMQADYPDNVHGLAKVIERLICSTPWGLIDGAIVARVLNDGNRPTSHETTYRDDLDGLEANYIIRNCEIYGIAEFSRRKGWDPANLRRRMKGLSIDPRQFDSPPDGDKASD